MKCPKCGYQSFNNLAACKKCGRDLTEIQAKLNFGSPVGVTPQARPGNEKVPPRMPAPAPEEDSFPEPAEQGLEDFFQSIDSPDADELPSISPLAKPSQPATAERQAAARAARENFPSWDQEPPQGAFPFDELDADLEALRLSASSAEPPAGGNDSPFDDVEILDIDWQTPEEQPAAAAAEPPPTVEPRAAAEVRPQPELPTAIADQWADEPATAPEEDELPNATALSTEPVQEEEWPLPERAAARGARNDFALSDAEHPSPPPAAPAAEEEPLAALEAAERAAIAAVFLPGDEPGTLADGAQLLARRAKASLADLGLLAAIFALFLCAGEIARSPAAAERFRFTGDVLLDLAAPYFLVLFALCFGYFTLFHYLSGQTPGKMLFDVRVEGDEHTDLTLAQAFLRCVGGLAALLPAGLGFISIVLDGEHRGWNDRLAGSRVVLTEEPEEG